MAGWLFIAAAVAAVAFFYRRRKPHGLNYDADEPITSEALRAIPSELRGHLVEADIIVRDYLKARGIGSAVGGSFLPRSVLPHSVAAIKNSLILVAAFRLRRAKNPNEVLRRLREGYWSLAFYPPTLAEAEEEWEKSGKDEAAMQEAARARAPETKSLAGAMQESGRLMAEFDEEVLAFSSD